MINWRKPLIGLALRMSGQPVFRHLKYLKSIEYKSLEELKQLQNEKLRQLLIHAYENVPYYSKVLSQAEVAKNKSINLDNFHRIPILTKDIIGRQGENLYSQDYKKRGWYINTSGGSTGEPVAFLQDDKYRAWSFAARFLCNLWGGKDVGEREIKLWGSERDVFEVAEKASTRLRRWGFNVVIMNSFAMSEERMIRYVQQWNAFKPKMVWAYMSAIHEFARYIERSGAQIRSPASIVSSAETLAEDVRAYVERIFNCPVFNLYGSREIGVGGSECQEKEGIHIFSLNNKMEILDKNLRPCQADQMGNLYVTTLNNYSMPLIRYDIGDMAVPAKNEKCSCKRAFPLIKNIVGRHIEVFKTREGKIVPGEFFVHFVGVVYNKNYIKKFQVVQKDYDLIIIKLVVIDSQKFEEFKSDLIRSIKKVMGQDCEIRFDYVDDIPPTKSGKYLYTVSEVS